MQKELRSKLQTLVVIALFFCRFIEIEGLSLTRRHEGFKEIFKVQMNHQYKFLFISVLLCRWEDLSCY